MKKIAFLLTIILLFTNCDDDDLGINLFGNGCNDCKFVNLLDSCEDSTSTKIAITCIEFERLRTIRVNNRTACIPIAVNPSDGSPPIEGFGKDWFFDCD